MPVTNARLRSTPQTDDQLEMTAVKISRNLSEASQALDDLIELVRIRREERRATGESNDES